MATTTAPPRERQAPLSPRSSAIAIAAVAACIAVLWSKLLAPQPDLTPNQMDRAQGCCDIFADRDVNAINVVVSEICATILERQNGGVGVGANPKLTKELVAVCRREVNTTCGIDIATILDHNQRLGRTHKLILDEMRSYNGSTCLQTNYGVAPWTIGVPHALGKFWLQEFGLRQERSPHVGSTPLHPALRERGRAIAPSLPGGGGSALPTGAYKASAPHVRRPPADGRVGSTTSSPLNVYYMRDVADETIPMGGMRPPMGGAGGVVPPPKSSVGFVMPLYTMCIIIFFIYTVFKMVFRRGDDPAEAYAEVKPDPEFRRRVFEENRSNRVSPETNKLVVNAISGLVAEVRQQMEDTHQGNHTNVAQDSAVYTNGSVHPYTNGSLHHDKKLEKVGNDPSIDRQTPPSWEDSTPSSEKPALPKDEVKEANEDKDKATVKVLGMEMTAHCEGGQKWMAPRPATPPVVPQPHHPMPLAEVSSIYLEGSLPQQSRLLVSDSETLTEDVTNGEDAPIVLSGKMTLSLINDEFKKPTPANETAVNDDLTYDFDDDFTTASAATVPKIGDDLQDDSDEEIEEEEIDNEDVEEVEEVEEIEEEEEEVQDVIENVKRNNNNN